ncbi:MAG TPA: ABC transporter permease [Flavobacterium sp.]|jgi:phospholipid/cholesterol/gamma-HCH transport system permease protein|uniref:MlaE family ABC transporter permease n=1 Tax=Flavobacterium sp. TaxID=239 RepID=UPI002B5697AC|nr:ABC transporter permease [Flavobacterium sp.]HPW97997.1 ABC transporter permease [Flavobacterium sp.]HQA73736.1 ABC transporter permease [Flavobacterium sp.]
MKKIYSFKSSKSRLSNFREKFNEFLIKIADVVAFLQIIFKNTFSKNFEGQEFLKQCYVIGNKSAGLISITGIIIGLVLTIQSRPPLVDFGAVAMLPGMVAVSLIREMGPVITALICAGKIGSSMGAELGSMRVTEQIDAMEVSNANPIKYLVVPRVLAATVMIPLLTLYADVVGIFGSWLGVNIKDDVSLTLFINQAFASVEFIDIIPAVIKSFFFGGVIGIVGCYKGYNAERGTESVGVAANSAVVTASLLVIIVDLVAVQITDLL